MLPNILQLTSSWRCKLRGHNSIRYHRDYMRIQSSSEHSVLFTCMRHTYDMINIRKGELEQFISQYRGCITETEQRVISKHSFKTHGACV